MNPIYIVIPIITLLTYSLGLTLKKDDFRMLVTKPLPMFVGLFGQLIVLPALAFLIAVLFELPEVFFVGLVLIACCPGGSSSNIFTYIARGDVALSVSMTAISSIVTLFTIPLVMALCVDYVELHSEVTSAFGRVHLPVEKLLIQNVVLMLVPIILGVATSVFFKNFAVKLSVILSKIAFPCLIILVTIFFIKQYHNIASYLDRLGLCVLTLVLLSVLVSSLMSRFFKQSDRPRRTIVIEVAMQNAAQAIAIASSPFVFNSEIMTMPAILYALMMNIVLLVYVGTILKKCNKKESIELY